MPRMNQNKNHITVVACWDTFLIGLADTVAGNPEGRKTALMAPRATARANEDNSDWLSCLLPFLSSGGWFLSQG